MIKKLYKNINMYWKYDFYIQVIMQHLCQCWIFTLTLWDIMENSDRGTIPDRAFCRHIATKILANILSFWLHSKYLVSRRRQPVVHNLAFRHIYQHTGIFYETKGYRCSGDKELVQGSGHACTVFKFKIISEIVDVMGMWQLLKSICISGACAAKPNTDP